MTLIFNENQYDISNFTLSITKDIEDFNFIERVDCSFTDNNIDLEILATQIQQEFQGDFTIINNNSEYNFIDYGFEDLRLFVDGFGTTKSISFLKTLSTIV